MLLVQATGWGKSVVYFLAARRRAERGATLVVSPLIALMRNQVPMAERFGLRAAAFHSENRDDWADAEIQLQAGQLDVLFVSPERLHNPEFRRRVLDRFLPSVNLAVIDEAHCISEWGHDFRPEYRSVLRQLEGLPREAAILAATATATARVEEDLKRVFGPFLEVQRGRLVRPSVRLVALEMAQNAERLAWLSRYLPRFKGSGIVYTLTVFDAKEVALWLRRQGIVAKAYHADLERDRRIELENAFSENRLKALVATTALGMGYDKADVGFVVHYQAPASLIAYYQQIGRAGRALDRAYAVLLAGQEDETIAHRFIDAARPPTWVFQEIGRAMEESPQRFETLAHRVAVSDSMVRHALDILASAEAVWRDEEGLYHADSERLHREIQLGESIRTLRREECAAFRQYVASNRCRMQSVAEALGDTLAEPCGVCDRCRTLEPPHLDPRTVAQAAAFLFGEPKTIVPRLVLPLPLLEGKRQIPENLRNAPGIVLAFYGDEGLGKLVKEGKYAEGRFGDALIEAAAAALEEAGIRADWLSWVPSRQRGAMEDFVHRMADRLGVEAVPAIRRVAPKAPQKTMKTSEEQFWNVWTSIEAAEARTGVCVLLDDIVDSGWTLTVAGIGLRRAGASSVVPLALAAASSSRIKFREEARP